MEAACGTTDGGGGILRRKLALQGLFLMSLALACLFHPPQEGLSARQSSYYLALVVLFLAGQGYLLLSVWASDLRTSQSALARQLAD